MPRFVYTVWFRDPAADPADQDHEWPACIRLIAETPAAAWRWGDVLARRRAHRRPTLVFLHSSVEADPSGGADVLPPVADGEEASDAAIGW